MPGAAATTAGMALSGGIAVMMWPSTMKSAIVSASKSGGGRKPTLSVTVGRPSIVITQPSCSIFQSGSRVAPLRQRTLRSTTTLSPTRPCQLAATPATCPAGMVHDSEVEVLGGLGVLGLAAHLVELHAEGVGDEPHRLAEHGGALGRHPGQVGIVDRHAEAGRPLGVGGVVEGGVGRLAHGDLVDPVADRRRRPWPAARRSPG